MKALFNKYYTNLFLENRIFLGLGIAAILFIMSFFFPWLGLTPLLFFYTLAALVVADLLLLYRREYGVYARRNSPERLSNGDENRLEIQLESFYSFPIQISIIDEIPFQFQRRDLLFNSNLNSGEKKLISYFLRPVKRGEYEFGKIHVYVNSPLGLISRRYSFDETETLPVYPSFLQMKRYELMAISNRLTDTGVKRIRRLGHSMEFEHIKNYVTGDDYRDINWKASARKAELMINSFVDEKSQHIYCVVDKSRAMKMPFDGLSLLDYAINASLVLANIALLKDDKAGLITLSEKIGVVVPADRKPTQLNRIMEVLFKEKSRYLEGNMEALYLGIRNGIKQRSLLVFFTNFESMTALERQLPFLSKIARFHTLLVIFFENTELQEMTKMPAKTTNDIYVKTIATRFAHEKRQIVKKLERHGIQSILTTPQQLTINTVNKYLDIKSRKGI